MSYSIFVRRTTRPVNPPRVNTDLYAPTPYGDADIMFTDYPSVCPCGRGRRGCAPKVCERDIYKLLGKCYQIYNFGVFRDIHELISFRCQKSKVVVKVTTRPNMVKKAAHTHRLLPVVFCRVSCNLITPHCVLHCVHYSGHKNLR